MRGGIICTFWAAVLMYGFNIDNFGLVAWILELTSNIFSDNSLFIAFGFMLLIWIVCRIHLLHHLVNLQNVCMCLGQSACGCLCLTVRDTGWEVLHQLRWWGLASFVFFFFMTLLNQFPLLPFNTSCLFKQNINCYLIDSNGFILVAEDNTLVSFSHTHMCTRSKILTLNEKRIFAIWLFHKFVFCMITLLRVKIQILMMYMLHMFIFCVAYKHNPNP